MEKSTFGIECIANLFTKQKNQEKQFKTCKLAGKRRDNKEANEGKKMKHEDLPNITIKFKHLCKNKDKETIRFWHIR